MRRTSTAVWSLARAIGVVTSLVALVVVATPARAVDPQVFGSEVWGWVVARQPSTTDYTPAGKDQGNSSGSTNTVHRNGKGNYTVTFGGLATAGGALIHVSPLGTAPRLCIIDDWGPSGSDYRVQLKCRSRAGAPADSTFVVNVLVLFTASDDLGYVVANQPLTADYTPDVQYNSQDTPNTIHRLGTGRWEVTLPGLGGAGGRGNVQVTASGVPATVCRVDSWTAGLVATVSCRDRNGAHVDTPFDLTYLKGRGLKFEGDPNVAYVLADRPTTASYTPTPGYRYSSAGIAPQVQRIGRGVYSVKLRGMPLGGSAQVTAYGGGSRRCVIGSIRKTGQPQRIGVRCFTADGSAPADARFTLTYAR